MLSKDIQIGQRVRVSTNGMTALVVGRPEYYTPRAKLVRVKFENSTRYEYKLNHQLELCDEQYPAHGGSYVKPEGDF